MILNDGRLLVIPEDTVRDNGFLAVYAVSAILALRKTENPFTGDVLVDFRDTHDAGLVRITDAEFRRINRWVDAGRFITVQYISPDKYRWGYATKNQLAWREYLYRDEVRHTGYLTEVDFQWLKIWTEAMSLNDDEDEVKLLQNGGDTETVNPTKKNRKRKNKHKKRKERKNEHWRKLLEGNDDI